MQKPSLGRVVRYNEADGQRTALIVDVHSDTCVNLAVFAKDGTSHGVWSVCLDDAGKPGSWSWPPIASDSAAAQLPRRANAPTALQASDGIDTATLDVAHTNNAGPQS